MLAAVLDIFEAIAVHLFGQIVYQLNESLVPRCFHNNVMESDICLGDLLCISGADALLKMFTGMS